MPPARAAVFEQGQAAGRGSPPADLRVQPELQVPQGRLPQPAGAEGHDVQHQGGLGVCIFWFGGVCGLGVVSLCVGACGEVCYLVVAIVVGVVVVALRLFGSEMGEGRLEGESMSSPLCA